jgi:glycosyltransferase involved in cell wall biosynthesis
MISVVIPVVKIKFFEKALISILNQSLTDFELIIVNSNSPDDVDSILKKYNDSRITYIRHGKLPIIENWNKCLSYAKGELFVLFSDDDIAEPDYLEELYNLSLKYPDVNLFRSRVKIIDSNDSVIMVTSSSPEYESAADFIWHRFKNYRMHFAPDFMCRTECLREIGGFIYFLNAWGSDDATWFTLANRGGIAATRNILFSWRLSDYNVSAKASLEQKLQAIQDFGIWSWDFINNKLFVADEEKVILSEIIALHPRRIQTQFAATFRLSLGNNYKALMKSVINWIRYRRKFGLTFYSLVWALMLIYKDIKTSFRNNFSNNF